MTSKVTIPNTFATATTAIPLSQLDANFSNVNAAINNALTFSNYALDTGTANNYAITITGQTTTYTAGLAFQFKAVNANSGASTLNVNGQGTQSIVRTDGTALSAGDIAAGAIVSVMYDGTNFQLLNDSGGKSETISNLTVTGTATINVANVTTFSPTITNAQLANSTATIGNTAVSLGSTVTTFGNVTMQNLTVSSVSTPITTAQGGTGQTSLTSNNVLIGNGSGSVTFVAPGTTGNVLTSDGITWISKAGSAGGVTTFSAGTTGFTPSTDTSGAVTLAGTLNVGNGGTGLANITLNSVMVGNNTSSVKLVAPGTSGNVLTSDGTTWTSAAAAGGGFAAGTRMIFAQDAAPTGWTKDTTNYNEHAIRIVTGTAGGTGGTVNFTTAFASQAVSGTVGTSGATTLATTDIPSHSHTVRANTTGCVFSGFVNNAGYNNAGITNLAPVTSTTGGGGSHTHTGGTFTGTAINLAVKYLNCITATKN